ncbi:hypothetical protein WAI453_006659 [Rhynchosporium graminicola]|uniref:DUF7143 domain-containing protein n=1 Tax=Rhynchosporium graminicola TaxID=2792576 RepID=A0A1E1K3L9_9HELO|nr:uncharacterized protein RCO7_01834 [Rhynchosporium commune]
MHATTLISALAFVGTALSVPLSLPRQANACFLVGKTTLPAEVVSAANFLAPLVTCSSSVKTISGVPDVTSGSTSFSSINFATSSQSPLTFALSEFATSTPLASTNLKLFQDRANVYTATEAGIRSAGGALAIKAPKFFLAFQIARIKAAQGLENKDPGQQVDHLLGKVTKNAVRESKATLDAITALSKVLA